MEESGRGGELMNLVNAAMILKGQSGGKYTSAPWSDAYVYNTMEAACMAMAIEGQGTVGEDSGNQNARLLGILNFCRLNRGGYTQVWMTEDTAKVIDPDLLAEMIRKVDPVKRPQLEKRSCDRIIVGDHIIYS
jgi:hypothetical protein